MGRLRALWGLVAVFLGVGMLAGAGHAQGVEATTAEASAELPRAMIVLDSSGSMWGRIQEVEKVLIARRSLGELFRRWDRKIALGISVYGHRTQGDCKDIQTLLPPGPLDAKKAAAEIAKVRPYGMTPLTRAVRLAAEQLNYTKRRASVILLTDGADNCEGDPCALGERLARRGKGVRVHVVAFATRPADEAGLQCLAEKTGGRFLRAGDGESLTKALGEIERALQQPFTPVAASGPTGDATQQEARRASGPTGNAAQQEARRALGPTGSADTQQEARRALGPTGSADTQQEAGRAAGPTAGAGGQAVRGGEASVGAFETVVKPATGGGTGVVQGRLTLRAFKGSDSVPLREGVRWELYRGQGKATRLVASSRLAVPTLELPTGKYQVRLKVGAASTSSEVELSGNGEVQHDVVLATGYVRLAAVLKRGARPLSRGVRWDVYAADAGAGARPVAGSYDPQAGFSLLSGTYKVRVQRGFAQRETTIRIRPGKVLRREIDLDAGMVRLSAWDADGEQLKTGLRWDVYAAEAGGQRRHVGKGHGAQPIFTLPAGQYVVVVTAGGARAEQPLSISAGDVTRLRLVLP